MRTTGCERYHAVLLYLSHFVEYVHSLPLRMMITELLNQSINWRFSTWLKMTKSHYEVHGIAQSAMSNDDIGE